MRRSAAGDAYHSAIDNPSPVRLIITRPVIDPFQTQSIIRNEVPNRGVWSARRPSRVVADEARNAESTRPEIVKIVHTPIARFTLQIRFVARGVTAAPFTFRAVQ